MNRGPTFILRAVIILIGLAVLAVCLIILPAAIRSEMARDFDYGPIFIGMIVSAIPFFYALYQALKLLKYIDNNSAFSEFSVRALSHIKRCGFLISGLYAAGMPYIFYVADRDDAPGTVAIGLIIIGASFIVATAAAVFERLFQNAVDIKAENDLTV